MKNSINEMKSQKTHLHISSMEYLRPGYVRINPYVQTNRRIRITAMDTEFQEKKKKLALVTGAAHRLGRDIALFMAHCGYEIVVHYHNSSVEADETSEWIEKQGVKAYTLKADLTDHHQTNGLFQQIRKIPTPLEILINSAAVMLRGRLEEFNLEQWDQTMHLNLRAVWWCSRLAAKEMGDAGGNIINVSDSGAGRLWSTYTAYSLSKAGVDVLTRMLAKELAPGIRVNAVAPGLIMPPDDFPEATWERLIERLPLERPGTTRDVCNAIKYLLENDYITGQILTVDGGYQLV